MRYLRPNLRAWSAAMTAALLATMAACTPRQHQPAPRAPKISWRACAPQGWQCGKLSVPLDYAKPGGRKIEIALNRHPATGRDHRIGSLLVNPGGPGASGIEFLREDINLFTALAPYFDLVGFDPRGVGASTPIKCMTDSELDSYNSTDAVPDEPGEEQSLIDESRAMAAGCAERSGDLLAHVDTVSAARDLDVIRQALGEKKLTYFGISYGTYLGDTYAHLFPTHVRALVLDSVLDPKLDETELTMVQAIGFEQDLEDYLASCAGGRSACPFQTADPRSELVSFLERLDRTPLAVGSRQLNNSLAMTGIAYTLYDSPSSWPALSLALGRAFQGDGELLMRFADAYLQRDAAGHYSNLIEANNAINCLDHPVSHELSYFTERAVTLAQKAPIFGPYTAYGDLPCAYWQAPPTRRPGPLAAPGAPRIVLIGSTGDPATPYEWAESVHSQLKGSILITRTGDGHGGYDASSCVQKLVNAYLIDLKVPADGQTCPSD